MFHYFYVFAALVLQIAALWNAAYAEDRTTSDFNDNWSFALVKSGSERTEDVNSRKIGDAWIPEETEDSKTVQFPHDWAIFGPFRHEESWGQEKLPWRGVGIYRRTFTLSG